MDWKGELFCGIHLNWDYQKQMVELSMPDYVQKASINFGHSKPSKPQHSPYHTTLIEYGSKTQQQPHTDKSPSLSTEQIRFIQQVIGTFLFFGHAMDPMLAAALSAIASRQNNDTEKLMKATKQLLDYVASHPNPTIRYMASNMILALDTD